VVGSLWVLRPTLFVVVWVSVVVGVAVAFWPWSCWVMCGGVVCSWWWW
jgi:hypothetical protein